LFKLCAAGYGAAMPRGAVEMFATALVLCLMTSAAFVIDVQSDNPGWYALPIGFAAACSYALAVLFGRCVQQRSW
jgi:membrane protein implicated in regulation of membrane protease activity